MYYRYLAFGNPADWDPNLPSAKFYIGERITVYMSDKQQYTGTYVKFVPPNSVYIQTDDGLTIPVDVNFITAAHGAPKNTPTPTPTPPIPIPIPPRPDCIYIYGRWYCPYP